jgi:hypothetical protein
MNRFNYYCETDSGRREVPADCTPEALQAQIADFIRRGGQITVVPIGEGTPQYNGLRELSKITLQRRVSKT